MIYPIKSLLKKEELLCIQSNQTIREAINLMINKDFSQLPVVDAYGKLQGIISEQTIVRRYHLINNKVPLLDLTVDHCLAEAITVQPHEDIFKALDLLKNTYAVIVVEDNKPKGILTDYDTTLFFHDLTGALLIIEDIEITIRRYIESIYPNDNKMQAALIKVFRNPQDPTKPSKEYEKLSLNEHCKLVTHKDNWPDFKDIFEPQEYFKSILEQVGGIRNDLVHFRDRPGTVEWNILEQAQQWISTRPKLNQPQISQIHPTQQQINLAKKTKGEYIALYNWLAQQAQQGGKTGDIRVTFQDIENLLQESLPSSAKEHQSWWSNDYLSDPQSLTWMKAGWKVKDVDLSNKGKVTFQRTNTVLMQLFFAQLLEDLKKNRPGITNATRTHPDNSFSFSAGRSGFFFGWAFPGEFLRVELYIDSNERSKNSEYFNKLINQKTEIEQHLGTTLEWDPLENRKACRISVSRLAKIIGSIEHLEDIRSWGVETMLKFIDTFQNRIKGLD